MSRADRIEEWIMQNGIEQQRRERQAPAASDVITDRVHGTAVNALENVSFFLGDHPEIPQVSRGQIRLEERMIVLTFVGDGTKLPEPFVATEDADTWCIDIDDALDLETGQTHGSQMQALVSLGNDLNRNPLLVSTTRWELMGSAGLAEYSQALMIGQVIDQATSPWADEQHIWLVGYGEDAPKLVSFLNSYHPEHLFHTVEEFDQITADDLAGSSATIYIRESQPEHVEKFTQLRERLADRGEIGALLDTSPSNYHMNICEDEDGAATLFPLDIKLFPNLQGADSDLYRAMEASWDQLDEEQKAAAEQLKTMSPEDFMDEPDASDEPAQDEQTISVEQLEAMMNRGTYTTGRTEAATQNQQEATTDPDQQESPEVEEPSEVAAETEKPVQEETEHTVAEASEEDFNDPAEDLEPDDGTDADDTEEAAPEAQPAADDQTGDAASQEDPGLEPVQLHLLGETSLAGETTSTGKPAEMLAYLHLHGPEEVENLMQALWPDAATTGDAARRRRLRVTQKIDAAVPDALLRDDQWQVKDLRSDLDQISTVLNNPTGHSHQQITAALAQIQNPLEDAGDWADQYRPQILQQLNHLLETLTDYALEEEHFDIAKSARAAQKRLS